TLLDYFPDNALIALDEPLAVAEEARKLEPQFGDSPYFMPWRELKDVLAAYTRLDLAQVAFTGAGGVPRVTTPMRSLTSWEGHTGDFWEQLTRWDADKYSVTLHCTNTGSRQRLLELLDEKGYRLDRDTFDLQVALGRLRAGFDSPNDKLAVLGEREIFGRQHVRRRRRRFEAGSTITAFADLKVGDYIVHEHHGIGRYLGLRRFAGKAGDFLALEYSNGDKLYVPVTNVDAIQRYTGAGGSVPKIDRIGGSTWAKTRARVRKAVRDMTEELVKLYAHREADAGIVYARDTPWQDEFEDSFEYDETPDQLRAITEVKRDMESPRPMDRLICGDVGFGKTEVALRAAFKAVMGGKQVAVLVPTTVLAEQHYLTFKERVAGYPIQVDMLSRFRSAKQQKATLEKLAAGEVDIIVGTHRLLSKDAKFSDLGLLVIDEEQRFGVAQKEKVKQMRTHVDVLTLTATPIPRTLNMALLDVRDMSVINTAPNDRLPIHTCIHQFDEALIREAIQRELAREGQVFFVHNRVHNILPFANLVRRLVPGARVAVGHGQMPEHELEDVMTAFIHGEVDVLVCTTIIGSGIDIPNANTIIINNADHFGLAELYQLRGRVGRYKHRAFAYLLVPGDRALTEDAQKRLKALEDFAVLGSGFGIALRDLEIRGCGNILGGEQHGQIASVGYDTYIQLIQEAVADMKGEAPKRVHLPPCDIAIDAFIPEAYVPSETQKITLYKRIAGVKSLDEVEEMRAELGDRFGPPPTPVKRLLDVMRVRAWAGEVGVKRIIAGAAAVAIEFEEGRYLSRKVRTALEQQFGGHVEFAWQKQPTATLTMDEDDNPLKVTEEFLKALDEV
ncbi:MAG: transcription-repair coupling factor, partial [Candidatus Hydrogenedentes bacterium]|nr:transcription-repair coupling factor [Candidatus Hydrogenedentota bacterium]